MKMKQTNINNDVISIAPKAAVRLKAVMESEGKSNFALRMSVIGGGCSGMTYNMSFDDNKGEFDKVYTSQGVEIYCDLQSWLYLKGTTIDFSDDILSGGFKITNPNHNYKANE